MLQKSTRGRWQKLKIDRIALKFFFHYCNFLKVVTLLLWKKFISYWEILQKWDLSFFSIDTKRCMFTRASFLIEAEKKTNPIFLIILNKRWIFFIKAKLLLLKKCVNKKKIQGYSINFKLFSMSSDWFLKHQELLQKN